jgi:signal transduction histidine kinase
MDCCVREAYKKIKEGERDMSKNLTATSDEAKALGDKAVALIQESGQEKAFAAFNDTAGDFVMKDLYIFVVDMNGTMLAHGNTADLIGKDMMGFQDESGKYPIKDMTEMAKTQSEGWVDYKWPHPITKSIGNKSTYFHKVGDMLICCGVYE